MVTQTHISDLNNEPIPASIINNPSNLLDYSNKLEALYNNNDDSQQRDTIREISAKLYSAVLQNYPPLEISRFNNLKYIANDYTDNDHSQALRNILDSLEQQTRQNIADAITHPVDFVVNNSPATQASRFLLGDPNNMIDQTIQASQQTYKTLHLTQLSNDALLSQEMRQQVAQLYELPAVERQAALLNAYAQIIMTATPLKSSLRTPTQANEILASLAANAQRTLHDDELLAYAARVGQIPTPDEFKATTPQARNNQAYTTATAAADLKPVESIRNFLQQSRHEAESSDEPSQLFAAKMRQVVSSIPGSGLSPETLRAMNGAQLWHYANDYVNTLHQQLENTSNTPEQHALLQRQAIHWESACVKKHYSIPDQVKLLGVDRGTHVYGALSPIEDAAFERVWRQALDKAKEAGTVTQEDFNTHHAQQIDIASDIWRLQQQGTLHHPTTQEWARFMERNMRYSSHSSEIFLDADLEQFDSYRTNINTMARNIETMEWELKRIESELQNEPTQRSTDDHHFRLKMLRDTLSTYGTLIPNVGSVSWTGENMTAREQLDLLKKLHQEADYKWHEYAAYVIEHGIEKTRNEKGGPGAYTSLGVIDDASTIGNTMFYETIRSTPSLLSDIPAKHYPRLNGVSARGSYASDYAHFIALIEKAMPEELNHASEVAYATWPEGKLALTQAKALLQAELGENAMQSIENALTPGQLDQVRKEYLTSSPIKWETLVNQREYNDAASISNQQGLLAIQLNNALSIPPELDKPLATVVRHALLQQEATAIANGGIQQMADAFKSHFASLRSATPAPAAAPVMKIDPSSPWHELIDLGANSDMLHSITQVLSPQNMKTARATAAENLEALPEHLKTDRMLKTQIAGELFEQIITQVPNIPGEMQSPLMKITAAIANGKLEPLSQTDISR